MAPPIDSFLTGISSDYITVLQTTAIADDTVSFIELLKIIYYVFCIEYTVMFESKLYFYIHRINFCPVIWFDVSKSAKLVGYNIRKKVPELLTGPSKSILMKTYRRDILCCRCRRITSGKYQFLEYTAGYSLHHIWYIAGKDSCYFTVSSSFKF